MSVWQSALLLNAGAYWVEPPADALPLFGKAASSMISHAFSCFQRPTVTEASAYEMVQPVVAGRIDARCHGLDAFAITGTNQSCNIPVNSKAIAFRVEIPLLTLHLQSLRNPG